MRALRQSFSWGAVLLLVVVVAACGGGSGGGGGSAPSSGLSLSTNSLSFSAASPTAPIPASKVVTATVTGVTSGTLFIKVVVTGTAVTSVSGVTVTSNTQGQATVNVAPPGTIGAGTYTSVMTVSACTTDQNCSGAQLPGSPQTVNVTYTVGAAVAADGLAPYIGTTGVAGDVIIRGRGFTPVTSVSFGGTLATTSTVVSDSEIHAHYPALAAATYAVQLGSGGGAVPFTGSLKIVNAPAYLAATIPYPVAPQHIRGLVYDAEQQALLVGVSYSTASSN